MENLEHVIEILSSNELFLPNLNNKDGIDSDVNKWLNNMVSNTDNSKKVAHSILTNEIRAMASQGALSEILIKEILPNSTAIEDVLKGFESWDFNIFELADVTGGRPLFFLAYHIFGVCGFKEELQIEDSVLRNFLTKIEAGYKPNPYHNSIHAADVMHAVYYFVYSLGLDELLTYEDCFSIIFAAIIHDFDHPGKTNAFLINNSDYLAIRYNDLAVLEHYHCAKAFELILDDANECNVFSNLPNEKFKPIRSSILSMVLATDMASHFEYIAKFKNKTSSHGLDFDDVKDRQLVMDIAIKCGDISNPSKNTDLCSKWADRIMEEFYNQGDAEKEKKIPVSMFMDRNTSAVYKCQIAFIDYLVTPLYEVWDSYINEDETFPGYANIGKSKEFWKKKQDEETLLAVPEK